MNGRRPTLKEKIYLDAVLHHVGCIACILDGVEIENPENWTAIHHDPDFGSHAPWCHLHAFGLCAAHHQGVFPPGVNSALIAVRHPPLRGTGPKFSRIYGTDSQLCQLTWIRIPDNIKALIGFDLSAGALPPEDVIKLAKNGG